MDAVHPHPVPRAPARPGKPSAPVLPSRCNENGAHGIYTHVEDDVVRNARAWPWVLAVHALAVLVLLVLVGGPTVPGAALPGSTAVPLLVLGLPGSLPSLVDPYPLGQAPPAARDAVLYGPAVLNLALHALVLAVVRRRSVAVVPG